MNAFMDRDLLWKAWPDSFLAMRGVSTVGGWQCLGERETDGERWHSWVHTNLDGDRVFHGMGTQKFFRDMWKSIVKLYGIDQGDLLPNVDPTDTATWGCLLRDLADACAPDGNPLGALDTHQGLTWTQTAESHWVLADGNRVASRHFDIDTKDPAEAFVLARIKTREDGQWRS